MASGQITTLLNSGMDAFTNLWDIVFTFPTNVLHDSSGYQDNYSVRANNFNPPEISATTSNSFYKAVQLPRLMPFLQGERVLSIELRLDSNYDLYDKLLSWKHIWNDPSGEGNVRPGGLADNLASSQLAVANDVGNYGSIVAKAYSNVTSIDGITNTSSDVANAGAIWSYFDVICTKVGTPTYQRSSSDFVTVTTEFIFGRFVEPFSSGSKNDGTLGSVIVPSINYL